MGQGFYTAIFFGCHNPPDCDPDLWCDLVHDAAVPGARARTRYEAEREWGGYLVADCGQGIVHDGDLAPVISYQTFALESLPHLIWHDPRFTDAVRAAEASYRRLRQAAEQHGLILPAGQLLLVNEYD